MVLLLPKTLFVNFHTILIFDPNLVSSVPLALGDLTCAVEVVGLSSTDPTRHVAPTITSPFAYKSLWIKLAQVYFRRIYPRIGGGPIPDNFNANPASSDANLKAGLWAFQLQVDDVVDILEPRHLYPPDNSHTHRSGRVISSNIRRAS